MKLLKLIFAIILPPVAVAMHKGFKEVFFINIILTLLFFIPGIIHAIYVITK